MSLLRFYPRSAGLVELTIGNVALHLVVLSRAHWFWGHKTEGYDGLLEYYGLGPLGMIVVLN